MLILCLVRAHGPSTRQAIIADERGLGSFREMMKISTRSFDVYIFVLALFCPALPAQTPAYFPLEVGNSWLYRLTGAARAADEYRSIFVDGQETIGGRQYFSI